MSKEVKKNKVALSEDDINGVIGGVDVRFFDGGKDVFGEPKLPKMNVFDSTVHTQQPTVKQHGFDSVTDGTVQQHEHKSFKDKN